MYVITGARRLLLAGRFINKCAKRISQTSLARFFIIFHEIVSFNIQFVICYHRSSTGSVFWAFHFICNHDERYVLVLEKYYLL